MQIAVVEVATDNFTFAIEEADWAIDVVTEARRLGLTGRAKVTTFKYIGRSGNQYYIIQDVHFVAEINPCPR